MNRSPALLLPFVVVCAGLVPACGSVVVVPEGDTTNNPFCGPTISARIEVAAGDSDEQSFIGQCLPATPMVDPAGAPACVIVEAFHSGNACICNTFAARLPVAPVHEEAVAAMRASDVATDLGLDCFCEIPLLTGEWAFACRTDPAVTTVDGVPVDGVCYVDATVVPPLGNPEIAAPCAANEKRMLRFAGKAAPRSFPTEPSVVFITCQSEPCPDAP